MERYKRTGNARFVWRAYRGLREAGLPIPEVILKCFDQWAGALRSDDDAAGTFRAMELGGGKRSHLGARRVGPEERRSVIAAAVRQMVERDVAPTAAIRQVAQRFAISEPAARKAYYAKPRQPPANKRKPLRSA